MNGTPPEKQDDGTFDAPGQSRRKRRNEHKPGTLTAEELHERHEKENPDYRLRRNTQRD